jgi:hypothetical protein
MVLLPIVTRNEAAVERVAALGAAERYVPTMSERSDEINSGSLPGSPDTDGQPVRRGPPPNPLYHPLFLPVLLVVFTLWFGFDAFLTSDPEMAQHQTFNRIMYLVMQPICFRTVPRGISEFLKDQEAAGGSQGSAS